MSTEPDLASHHANESEGVSADGGVARGDAPVSTLHATAQLPVISPGAFSKALVSPDDTPSDAVEPIVCRASKGGLETIVKTDSTRCLIRALRARVEPPLASAADAHSLNPKVRELQEKQRLQHDSFKVRSSHVNRRRHGLNPSASGRLVAGAHQVSRSDIEAKKSRTSDRLLFGSVTVGNIVQGVRAEGWESTPRECRQACIRTSLSIALRYTQSPVLRRMYDAWEVDPSKKQSVTGAIRRELADTVSGWNMQELQCYLRAANLTFRGAASRSELARSVASHLRPPIRR